MSGPCDNSNNQSIEKKSKVFLKRLVSSIVLWGLVILALFLNNSFLSDYVFLILMMVISGFGLMEYYRIIELRGLRCYKWWGLAGGLLLMVCTFFYLSGRWVKVSHPAKANDFEVCFLILFVLGLCVWQVVLGKKNNGFLSVSVTLFGLMYVPWLLNFIQKINFLPGGHGPWYVLFFIIVTKFSDIGAYVVGSLIGKHKMVPSISPGKTWEGFCGAIVFSLLSGVFLVFYGGSRLGLINIANAMILGVLLGVSAIVGDLIESLLKREAGIKDSGQLFPGIGGVLDLIDSLLFNAPLMYLYLRHVLSV
jgi:phosphatidate cytidylyltransferase